MKSVKKNIKKTVSQEKTPAVLFLRGIKNLLLAFVYFFIAVYILLFYMIALMIMES